MCLRRIQASLQLTCHLSYLRLSGLSPPLCLSPDFAHLYLLNRETPRTYIKFLSVSLPLFLCHPTLTLRLRPQAAQLRCISHPKTSRACPRTWRDHFSSSKTRSYQGKIELTFVACTRLALAPTSPFGILASQSRLTSPSWPPSPRDGRGLSRVSPRWIS
jgi:hypothetical protein